MSIRKRCSDQFGQAPLLSPGRPSVAGREERQRFWAAIAAGTSRGTLRSGRVCHRRSEQDGSGRQAACHPRCLDDRRRRCPAGIFRWRAGGDCASSCAGLHSIGGHSLAQVGSIDNLAGGAAQRRHSQRWPRVSRDDRAIARRASGSPPKAGEACAPRGIANLCGGTSGGRRRRSKRGCGSWPGRVLERALAWTTARPAVGKRLEPGADRPPLAGRCPGR